MLQENKMYLLGFAVVFVLLCATFLWARRRENEVTCSFSDVIYGTSVINCLLKSLFVGGQFYYF